MRRRTYLRSAGLVTLGLAGCLQGEPEAANEFDYYTNPTEGIDVPLVPVADAIDWYRDDAAVFVDARGEMSFERSRIAGAVFSPAPDGQESEDPIEGMSTDQRLVTYCGCPHHLSTLRGASLVKDGYVHTYAIMEGFGAWRDAGYPLEGTQVDENPDQYTITGRTSVDSAGEYAWAWHDPSGQREAAPIDDDGAFSLHLQFYDIRRDSPIRVETPAGSVTRPLVDLVDRVVEIRGSRSSREHAA